MVALLIDVLGIIILIGGLLFGFIVFLIGKCRGSKEGEEEKKIETVAVGGVDQKNHG